MKERPPIVPLAYSPAQAAAAVGRSHSRIKKAIREKEIMALKDGRATLITRAELERWLAQLPSIGRQTPDALAVSDHGDAWEFSHG